MVEDDIKTHQCRFCYSSFSDDILKKIKDDRDDVYCEICGDLVKRVQNGHINEPKTITKTAPNIPFVVKEPPQEVLIDPDALLYPNGRVFYDTDFPQIFKSNFIIVFSRLVYFNALHLEKEDKINMEELVITENIVNEIHRRISPIHDKRIKAEFVKNLHEITLDEFELNLKKLQRKFRENKQYREDFIIYSRWLIKRVLTIILEKKHKDQLTKFENIVLQNINLNSNPQFLRNLKHGNNLLSENQLSDKIMEYSLTYQKKELLFNDFLKHQIKNLYDLKSLGILQKIILQYKKTRRRAMIFSRGFAFSNSFKLWIKERHTFLLHSLEEIDNNFEILQYVIYTLIEESKKPSLERKFLVNIADDVGLSRWSVTQIASILNQFEIIDYDSEYGIKSISEREKSKIDINVGSLSHKAFNNLITTFFMNKFQKKYYSEPFIFKPISQKHPDGLIDLNQMGPNFQYNFDQNLSKKLGREIYNYEFAILDFTIYSIKSIKNKVKKYYPAKNTLFLIIGIGLKEDFKDVFKKFFLPKNILVINPNFFRELIQIDEARDNRYLDIFNKILKGIKEKNIDGLNKILEETNTPLYSTNELEEDLKVSQLSKIFFNENKKREIYLNYIKLINRDITNLVSNANLTIECERLAIKIIEIFFVSDEASMSIDHISYVGGSVYLAAKYLFLDQITIKKITEKLRIDKISIENRLNEFEENVRLINYLINFSIDRILKRLNIKSQICKELTKQIINIAYEKIFNRQIQANYSIILTAIYLSTNNLGFNISQEFIAGSKNRSSIYNIINSLKKIKEEFKKISVDLEDIIKKKEESIIELIGESDGITFNQINEFISLYPENHLKNLILKGYIIVRNGFYYLSNQGNNCYKNIKNFEEFFDFYILNPKEYGYSLNKYYYDNCPYLPKSTVRAWIHQAEKKLHPGNKKITGDAVLLFILKNGLTSAHQLVEFFRLPPSLKKRLYEIINDLLNENILEKVKTDGKAFLKSKYSKITTSKEFFEFYNKFPKKLKGSSNNLYFELCPDIPQNTIRTWIHRARKKTG